MMRERKIEAYLVRQVRLLGGETRKVRWVGHRGAPDRVVMLPPVPFTDACYHTIWVEVKAPGKKTKPHQEREHARMRALGQNVEVVDSIERVDEVLR